MSDRKAVNKYYPPDWDPSKGSINQYVGQHPLRDRARKLHQGILVIRFEMPYNIWCGGCNSHIGMGVRYNAEKSKVGKYYSTPIYKFRMKCHLCDNYFEIQTDPKNHDYVILSGARRKEQRWDPHENEQIVPEDKATQKKMALDAMYKLEHGTDDKQKSRKSAPSLAELEGHRDQWKDDYELNKLARSKFRREKVIIKETQAADNALLVRSSLSIPLADEHEDDKRLAGLLRLQPTETYDEKQLAKRKAIENRPLFTSNVEHLSISNTLNSSSSTSSTSPAKAGQDSRLEQARKRLGLAVTSPGSVFSSEGASIDTPSASTLQCKLLTGIVVKARNVTDSRVTGTSEKLYRDDQSSEFGNNSDSYSSVSIVPNDDDNHGEADTDKHMCGHSGADKSRLCRPACETCDNNNKNICQTHTTNDVQVKNVLNVILSCYSDSSGTDD